MNGEQTTDEMTDDIVFVVRALTRSGLLELGDVDALEHFAQPGTWTVRLDGDLYVVTWTRQRRHARHL